MLRALVMKIFPCFVFLILQTSPLMSQNVFPDNGPPPPQGLPTPDAPIDGGITLLLAAGAGLGYRELKRKVE